MITSIYLGWAAGFLEGEGCFSNVGESEYTIDACQVNRDVLDRLQSLFGGKIYGPRTNKGRLGGPIFDWKLYG